MNLFFTAALNNTDLGSGEQGEGLKVLVMYEDAKAGNRALANLNRIAGSLAGQGRLWCALWEFGFLVDHSLLHIASREAVAADVVLLAFSSEVVLPEGMNKWFNLWLGTKHACPVALGVIADKEDADGDATEGYLQLQELARRGNMDFFATGGQSEGGVSLTSALTRAAGLAEGGTPCRAASSWSPEAIYLRAA
jgi:hypothetical protein